MSFIDKLADVQFKNISDQGWLRTALLWCIDSKYREYMHVNEFLKKQITDPDKRLVEMANALRGDDVFETVYKIEDWVVRNLIYENDNKQFGMMEKWADAVEVLKNRADDCDGQNLLIWTLCVLAGIDRDMIYCVLGSTKGGYHFYCLFFDTGNQRDRFIRLDATYYPEPKAVSKKDTFVSGKECNYKRPDYVFNDKYVYQIGK